MVELLKTDPETQDKQLHFPEICSYDSYRAEPRPWHKHYPKSTPAGIVLVPQRVEQLLLRAAERYPTRRALHYFRTEFTYERLIALIQQVAGNLHYLCGLAPGDRIMLVLPNCPEFVTIFFAAHWLGAQVVPVSPLLSHVGIKRLLRLTRPKVIIGLDLKLKPTLEALQHYTEVPQLFVVSLAPHLPPLFRVGYWYQRARAEKAVLSLPTGSSYFHALTERIAPVIPQPALTDASLPATFQPTSGTTGTQKVAVLTHANLYANVAQLHVWSGLKPGTEVVFGVLPFYHVFGSTVAMLAPLAGGATVLLQARFDTGFVWRLIEEQRPNVAPMVPFMLAELCEEMRQRGRDLKGLRQCMVGAAPLSQELRDEFQERTGATVFTGYGLSEASPVVMANPPDTPRSGTIGLPLPNTDARIVDLEGGTEGVPVGEPGELIIRGPQVMAGYLDNPEETANVIRGDWLYTGDIACRDTDGHFTIVDRKKDMVITGGHNVFPTNVEAVLQQHPSVAECAVVGMPDPRYGQRLVAHIVTNNKWCFDPRKLEQHCRRSLAGYAVPRTYIHTPCLPKDTLQKVRRNNLRTRS